MRAYRGETDDGQEILLTVHEDEETGAETYEVATRRFSWETWSAPLDMQLVHSAVNQ